VLVELAGALGGVEQARALCHEEMLICMAVIEHSRTVTALQEQLDSFYANPPLPGQDDNGKSECEWCSGLADVEAELRTELDCWHYPLDHPRGERFLSQEGDGLQGTGYSEAGEGEQ